MPFFYKWVVEMSILNIAGTKRYEVIKEVNAASEKIVRDHIHRYWVHSKPRILKVTRTGAKQEYR